MSDPVVLVEAQPWRIAVAAAVFVALFALVANRLHQLQVDQCDNLSEKGNKQRNREWTIPAPRGTISDTNGVPLAVSDGKWSVYADTSFMDDRLRATVELSRLLELDRDELRLQFETRLNGRRLAKGLDDEHAEAVTRLKLDGIYLRREFSRTYPEGRLAPHVLGFVLADGKGGGGIEQQFDSALVGVDGHETLTVDALGHPSRIDGDSRPASPGANLQLTIDVPIQRFLQAALAEAVEKHRPQSAAGIVLRPATGEVLGMASWPDFDPADMVKLQTACLRNNAMSFVYEPGSTMKPMVAGAAVAEKLTSWTETIDCEHGHYTHRVGRATRTVHEKTGGHGLLSVIMGIALSDNVLMAKLGIRLGPERLHRWIMALGFGRKTGISLPGEDAGLILPRSQWTVLGACMSIPMGHEIGVTPLQMAGAHAATANGGLWLPPRLIKRVYQSDPATGAERELGIPAMPEPRQVWTSEQAARIQEAMTHVMVEGTGERAKLDGYTSAGKTGTAEKILDGHYSPNHNIGSFVCWAPAESGRRAELLCLVVIDDPSQNGRFGAETAAPVVQKVLQQSLEYLRVPKSENLSTRDDDDEPVADRVPLRRHQ